MALAMARFWVTARICRPNGVRFRRSISAAKTTSEKTMIHRRL